MTREEIGRLGGRTRSKNMSAKRRKLSAQAASKARWDRYRANLRTCPHCGGKGVLEASTAA